MLFRCCCRPVLIPIFFTWAENVMIVNVNNVIVIIVMMMRYLILYPHLLHLLKIVMIIIFVIVIIIIVLFIILFMVIRVVTNLIIERPGRNVELFAHLQSRFA